MKLDIALLNKQLDWLCQYSSDSDEYQGLTNFLFDVEAALTLGHEIAIAADWSNVPEEQQGVIQ